MICADAGRAAARHDNCSDALDKREGMCYSRCHEQSEAVEVATRRWVARAQSLLGPASPCTCGQTCGGGRSYQCRGGSDRHVGSLLGGAFKPSRLAARAVGGEGWFAASGVGGGFAWRAPRACPFAASGPAWRTAPFGACEHFTHFGRDRQPRPAAGACLE